MKALVKFDLGREGMGLRDVPEPIPKEGELKVKVLAAGICGGDIHSMRDERPNMVYPCIMGHEYVGQVVETCGDVGDFKTGEWVVTLPACYSCGECDFCRKGEVTLCPERKSIGTHVDGCMAEYVVVPAKYSFKLPPEVTDIEDIKQYALIEPMTCAVRGIYNRIDVHAGDVVALVGPGTIGLFALQAFKSRGAYVVVYGLPDDKKRLELALELGADVAVYDLDVFKKAIYAKNPAGADISCEAVGIGPTLDICLDVVRTHGVHLQLGGINPHTAANLNLLFDKEVNYIASNSTAMGDWTTALWLLNTDRINLKPLMSLQVPLEDWNKGFDAVLNKEGFKVLLLP